MGGGGAERVALRLADDWISAGYEVDLVLQNARGDLLPLVPPEVKVFDLKARRIRGVVAPLRGYFRHRKPAAMQVSMWPLTVAAIIAHRLARSAARLVLSDHIMLSRQYSYFGRGATLAMRASLRLFYPLADARILVSKQGADDLARLAGIPRSSIEVVYNPVAEPPAEATSTPEVQEMWGDANGRVLTVGRLAAQKNHELLIRAFALVRRKRAAKLIILGEGELRQRLQQLIAEEGLQNDVLLPGFVTNPWPYLGSADLFALSSNFEGYPLVLIEAMRSGLPVVSTDCESGPREILDGGRYGALVPMGDADALAEAILESLERPIARDTLVERAESLSGQSTSDRYLELMLGDRS
jgi:glycosyltransferase involved in cell wall biosynthesis